MASPTRSHAPQKRPQPEPPIVKATRESLPFQRREWIVQRVCWVLLALVTLAALAGLFGGGGPLADRTQANQAATLEFEGFTRRHRSTQWILHPRLAPAGGELRVTLDVAFARRFRITEVQPQPASTRLARDQVIYEFDAQAAGASIVFHVAPQQVGWNRGSLRVGDAPPFQLAQFVYP